MLKLPATARDAALLLARTELKPMSAQDRECFSGVEDPDALMGEVEDGPRGIIIIAESASLFFQLVDQDDPTVEEWVVFDLTAQV